jgi:predicted metalloprotease with PDZ domain
VNAASEEAGEDMSDFFARFVDGTEELELPALLGRSGVKVESEPEAAGRGWAGIVGNGKRIESLDPDSPAANAGLMIDDEPIAVDGSRIGSVKELRARLSARAPKTSVEISFFRRGRLERRMLELSESPYVRWSFVPSPNG